MATSPITVSVADPVSADIQAVCGAITAICNVLVSPAGQDALRATLAGEATVNKAISDAWHAVTGLFKK